MRAIAGTTVDTLTREGPAETDAIAIDSRIRSRFPQITRTLAESDIRDAVGIISSSMLSSPNFLKQWLENRLSMWTDIDDYDLWISSNGLITLLDKQAVARKT